MSKNHIITGLRAVEQLLSSRGTEISKIYAEYQTANPRVEAIIAKANASGIEVQPANRARLSQISGESRHQGVVAEIVRTSVLDEAELRTLVESRIAADNEGPLLLLILDGIQDPHNLGACLRTADAAGVDAVVVPRHGAAGLGPTVSKVAAGAAESVNFAVIPNIQRVMRWLQGYSVAVVGTSDAADATVYDSDLARHLALIMGREETGLRPQVRDRCDEIVSLPMQGAVSSLNVSVATGICLYEALRQRAGKSPD